MPMQVLLTHAYFLHEDSKEQTIMRPYPPLGILYLSAWLDRFGVENSIFDTTFAQKSDLQAYLLEHQPPVLALYVNLMTKLNVIDIIRFVRQNPALQKTRIVLGGPDVTHNTAEYLNAGADIIVIGEGEQTLLEVLMSPPEMLAEVPGIAFLSDDGQVFKTAPREKLKDIDELPLPNRQKIDLNLYLQAWKQAHGQSAVSLSTQRGCPYTCRWCSTAVYGQSYRRRSPELVVDEIQWLQQHYDFDLIWFVDDVFTVSHLWIKKFRDELQARKVQVQFECITRADRLTEEILEILRECGCFRVWIGAESGAQSVIDAMDRRVKVEQVRDMIRAARRTGIQAGTFIMLGYPGETEADIAETVEHLKASNPDIFTITVAYPIKGTGLYADVESTAHAALPWESRTDRDIDFKRTYSRRYYDYAVRWTVNAVHWHKARLEGSIMHPKAFKFWTKATLARTGMWWHKNLSANYFSKK
jgi:anaerobic magnesium-protoporphyrin IX monomethyl ester cyclase